MNSQKYFLDLLNSNTDLQIENYTEELKKIEIKDLHSIVYFLWRLPKWKKQVSTIQLIVENIQRELFVPLIELVSKELEKMESDRKDKFFYLLSLLFDKIEININNLETILSYSCKSSLSYYWRLILNKLDLNDEDIKNFLVNYVADCPPHLLYLFEGVEMDSERIRELLKRQDLGYSNRGFLIGKINR